MPVTLNRLKQFLNTFFFLAEAYFIACLVFRDLTVTRSTEVDWIIRTLNAFFLVSCNLQQDDVETGEDFGYLPSGENSFQQIAELTAQASTIPYPSRGFGTEVSWNQEIPMQGEQDVDSSPETSLCASDDSEDVGIIEHNPLPEDASQSLVERTDQRRSISLNIGYLTGGLASVSGAMLQTSTIEGSPEPDKTLDSILNIGPSSRREIPTTSMPEDTNSVENRLHQESEMDENREFASDEVEVIDDEILAVSYGEQPAKRPRLSSIEEDGVVTGGLSKDLHL